MWGVCVLLPVTLTSVMYTIFATRKLHETTTSPFFCRSVPLRWLPLALIAPLLPVLYWWFAQRLPSRLDRKDMHDILYSMRRWTRGSGGERGPWEVSALGSGVPKPGYTFVSQVLAPHEYSLTVQSILHSQTMGRHINGAHTLFSVGTVFGAVAQSAVQLLAAAQLGLSSMTTLQSASLCVCLLSILSKVFAFRSTSLLLGLFRFLVTAHDVSLLFFIIVTLQQQDKLFAVFNISITMDAIRSVFQLKFRILTAALYVPSIILAVYVYRKRDLRILRGARLLACFPCLLPLIPMLVICLVTAESCNLAWLTIAFRVLEPKRPQLVEMNHLYTFFTSNDRTSYEEKMRFAAFFLTQHRKARVHTAEYYLLSKGTALRPVDLTLYWIVRQTEKMRLSSSSFCLRIVLLIAGLVLGVAYTLSRLINILFPLFYVVAAASVQTTDESQQQTAGGMGERNPVLQFAVWEMNAIQLVSFSLTILFGTIALFCLPIVYRYLCFLLHCQGLCLLGPLHSSAHALIEGYYCPKTAVVLVHCCPIDVLPPELLIDSVAPYMPYMSTARATPSTTTAISSSSRSSGMDDMTAKTVRHSSLSPSASSSSVSSRVMGIRLGRRCRTMWTPDFARWSIKC